MKNLSKADKQLALAVKVSRMYYNDKLSQVEISKTLNISRPTISRLLQLALDRGIVTITIHDPFNNLDTLDTQLAEKYKLKKVIIGNQVEESYEKILEEIGKLGANYLASIVKDNDTIGMSWGKTVATLSRYLKDDLHQNIKTVCLKGTVANSTHSNYSNLISQNFNRAFHTQTQLLPVPLIFESKKMRDTILEDHIINQIMEEGIKSQIAIFTVGTTRSNAMLFDLGYFNKNTIQHLQKDSVGDIISQFIDKKGNLVDSNLEDRTMAMHIDYLKNKRDSIFIAGGKAKVEPMHAALVGEYANTLITDLNSAQELLKM